MSSFSHGLLPTCLVVLLYVSPHYLLCVGPRKIISRLPHMQVYVYLDIMHHGLYIT